MLDYIKALLNRNSILIHGSYYTTNIGDRAIAIVLKNELKKRGYRSTIVSHFCSNPVQKKIVVGGGGVMHNLYENNLELRTIIVNNNRNVIYIGIGCPGFQKLTDEDKENIKKLNKAKFISVRDDYSLKVLKNYIDYEPDILACPAWLINRSLNYKDFTIRNFIFRAYYNLLYHKKVKKLNERTKIGVILNGHFNLSYLPGIKQMLKELSYDNELILIPFVGEDLEFYKKELSDLSLPCNKLEGPIKTFKEILKMDKVVATRYHSVIFSILAQKPVMILAYSQKVVSLAADLELSYFDLTKEPGGKFKFNDIIDQKLISSKVFQAENQIVRIIDNLV